MLKKITSPRQARDKRKEKLREKRGVSCRREQEGLLQVPEWHCFSLQLPDRTLDFAAPTDQEAVAWTIGAKNVTFPMFVPSLSW